MWWPSAGVPASAAVPSILPTMQGPFVMPAMPMAAPPQPTADASAGSGGGTSSGLSTDDWTPAHQALWDKAFRRGAQSAERKMKKTADQGEGWNADGGWSSQSAGWGSAGWGSTDTWHGGGGSPGWSEERWGGAWKRGRWAPEPAEGEVEEQPAQGGWVWRPPPKAKALPKGGLPAPPKAKQGNPNPKPKAEAKHKAVAKKGKGVGKGKGVAAPPAAPAPGGADAAAEEEAGGIGEADGGGALAVVGILDRLPLITVLNVYGPPHATVPGACFSCLLLLQVRRRRRAAEE
jgi:hypothetical protein